MPDTPGNPKLPASGLLLAAQIRYQIRLLLANGRTVAICIGLPVILLVTSGISHGHASAAAVASPATFGLTLAAWNAGGVRLVAAREAGVLKRWRATPLPRWCYFLGRIIATAAVGALAGAVTVAVGVCFYHVHLTAGAALVILVVFVLGAAAWAASATALTSAIPTVEAATVVLVLIYFPVLIVSGLLGSISEPHWLTTLASYLPVRPLAGAVTSALRHVSGTPLFPAHDLLTLAVWAAAGLAAAIITFRWEPHRPTQRRAVRATPVGGESRAPTARPALATQPQGTVQLSSDETRLQHKRGE